MTGRGDENLAAFEAIAAAVSQQDAEPQPDRLVVVAADEHPALDDWVREQAQDEATKSGLRLGDYLGREDVLPHPEGLCCHVFAAFVTSREP